MTYQGALRIDIWSPQKLAKVYTTLLIFTLIILILSERGPSNYQIVQQSYEVNQTYPMNFRFQIENLNRLHLFLSPEVILRSKFVLGVVLTPLIKVKVQGTNNLNSNNTHTISDSNKEFRVHLSCPPLGNCTTLKIASQAYLKYQNYIIDLEITDDSGYFPYDKLFINFYMEQPKYSYFLMLTKYTYLMILIVWLFIFTKQQSGIPWSSFTYEQKSIYILLWALVFANDPLFSVIFISSWWIPVLLDRLFLITFFCILMVHFLCVVSSYRVPKRYRTIKKFYLPKILIIFVVWNLLIFNEAKKEDLYSRSYDKNDSNQLSQKDTFLTFGFSFVLFATWSWGKTKRVLKQKRYIKRFTFYILVFVPVLIIIWIKIVKLSLINSIGSSREILLSWFILNLYLIFLSYGWLYHNPNKLRKVHNKCILDYSLSENENENESESESESDLVMKSDQDSNKNENDYQFSENHMLKGVEPETIKNI